ncbi:unnamed protein product [Bursaphelenchus xylophilus]|uniref:(pine wood nematode) hypothetical protein n=1 Tax=Bursaphelenchus xylophilus TaxID=6326 RepID=A0A1I7RVY6_BURXY|nr:unnamed protein product [Bursaphelenchus xylophilus]CAG9094886.1 unnamed protein product [Bursaphelenchus xylophilus]
MEDVSVTDNLGKSEKRSEGPASPKRRKTEEEANKNDISAIPGAEATSASITDSSTCNSALQKTSEPQKPRLKTTSDKEIEAFSATMPTKIVFNIKNGIRYCSPYWGIYKTETKGRWVGRRLVEVFQTEFLSFNPDYIVAAVRRGRVLINGKQMTNLDHLLKLGEKIEHIAHRHEHPVLDVPIEILAETDDLLVVNKPSSMPVHACGNYKIHTVLGLLWKLHGIAGLRVLHRLDRTTSGVLLFAKNLEADRYHKELIKSGKFIKEYVCRVDGEFPTEPVVCEQPIGTLVVSMGIQCVRKDGKSAKSTFRRVWYNKEKNQSLVLAHIETGRTHQIRVHLQYLGYPIVDDLLYNCKVWGPEKGKNAEYGKDLETLAVDVKARHRATLWQEEKDPDYDTRIKAAAEDPDVVNQEPWDTQKLDDGPDYDPLCLSCNVVKKTPTMAHFRMPLHCWRYETEKWTYKATLPRWAWPPPKDVVVDINLLELYDDKEKLAKSGQAIKKNDLSSSLEKEEDPLETVEGCIPVAI